MARQQIYYHVVLIILHVDHDNNKGSEMWPLKVYLTEITWASTDVQRTILIESLHSLLPGKLGCKNELS